MKRLIIYLKRENARLREQGPHHENGTQQSTNKVDTDSIINNLMDKVNALTEEKERLQSALRTLKENSTLADKSPLDKQLWVLKRTNAKLNDEKRIYEDRISQLQKEILTKNLKIEELSTKLGLAPDTRILNHTSTANFQSNHRTNAESNWVDRLKSAFV